MLRSKGGARRAAALLAAAALAGCAGPTMTTRWGSEWATRGVRLVLEETARLKVEEKMDVIFRLRAEGVPKGVRLLVWHKSRGGRPVRVPGVYVGDDGRLISVKDRKEAELHAWGLARGESYDLGAISADETVRAYVKAIPFPLEARGPGRMRVWAELASARGDAWLVSGEGFEPGEEVNTVIMSGDEVHLDVVVASPVGTFSRVLFPAAWFRSPDGTGAWKATAKSGSVEFALGWGARALRPE